MVFASGEGGCPVAKELAPKGKQMKRRCERSPAPCPLRKPLVIVRRGERENSVRRSVGLQRVQWALGGK